MGATVYKVVPLENSVLKVKFMNGTVKTYDVKQLIGVMPPVNGRSAFDILCDDTELFNKVHVDLGREIIVWDDFFDLDAEDIWDDGVTIDKNEWTEEDERRANPTPINYYVDRTAKKLGIEVFVDLFYTDQLEAPETVVVRTQGYEATVDLKTYEIIDGKIPDNVLSYVMRWIRRNRRSLNKFWKKRLMEKPA